MGLAHRVIPTLLCKGDALYKGERFNNWRQVGHARQAVRIHQARGVDELLFLDITATKEKRRPNFDMVRELTAECFMPITVGGGIRSSEDVRELLNAGADKVAICTMALERPSFTGELVRHYGSQAIVVAIDVRSPGHPCSECGSLSWDRVGAVTWAKGIAASGAGEILLNSVDRDGTMQGYDLELIRAVSAAVSIPVVASGGAGTYQHMLEAIQAGASAVAAGSMFLFTDQTPRGAAEYLAAHGVEARL